MTGASDDPYDLARFVAAQKPVYEKVRAELAAGRKRSHWMWFVFPQIEGLGASAMAQRYAIHSLAEAAAYVAHPLLGARLKECVRLVNKIEGRSAHEIFGSPDNLKFHSSVTLFAAAAPQEPHFGKALDKYFAGRRDPLTVNSLSPRAGRGQG
ncbi:DUF1810 domain-containing protein [Methylocystis sp. L43]|jgi:uncharacterized protein (DUF1810 family)|uniref:DUF1810 domain-containing protein n=1 Tax=unclassified Methylocystis TaxID=2625913 RepID=UPI0018C2D8F5|nr:MULTISPECIES: DUF1810 domain-containing protein [unclassified Methylocystis]MBG0799409.1 DUF1810 domain-containing protein [Methylocystis sp. L43]MBG0807191.1 DUF1810 domain-containing protein [Methylocystis sp. H15]